MPTSARSRVIASCCVIGMFLLIGQPAGGEDAGPSVGARAPLKITDDLWAVLERANNGSLIPVTIIMQDQASRDRMNQFRGIRNHDERRRAIKNFLKPLADRSQQGVLALLRSEQQNGRVGGRIRTLWMVNVVAADASPDVIRRIAALDEVAEVAHNPPRQLFDEPESDGPPAEAGNIECGVELMGAPRLWGELGITGEGVVVCMIDSGSCYRHTDLQNRIWSNEDEIPNNGIDDDNNGFIDDTIGWNFHLNNNDPDDFIGHGTHTAGTVAGDGAAGTQTGMAPGAKLMLCRVSGGIGEADEVMVWDSMQYAVDNGAHVWNMSLGWAHAWNPRRRIWRDLCINAIVAGVVPVIAAGNEGSCCPPFDHTRTPGDVPEVVTAGATNCNDIITGFSSRGPVTGQDVEPYNDWPYPPGKLKPTVSAPGDNTHSTRRCSGYTRLSGTSMATPHVAGAVALILAANPDLTVEEVKEILIQTAVDFGQEGWDNAYGAGRVDAFAAVELAMSMRNFFFPEDVTIVHGLHSAGELADLFNSDDARFEVHPGFTQDPEQPPVWLEIVGTSPTATPSEIRFILEARVSTPAVTQTIALFNYIIDDYEVVDVRSSTITDSVVEVIVEGDPSRFVDNETLEIKAQLKWKPPPLVLSFPWTVGTDQAVWRINE